jgi:uncharacterized protein (TIGR02444 family)
MVDTEKHPFWQFSISVYARDGVAPACIALQEECGVDVNILLFCCWGASIGGGRLSGEELQALHNAVSDWNQGVVQGLRVVRNRLKGGVEGFNAEESETLRQRILGIEINAEHKEQIKLAETVVVAGDEDIPAVARLRACALNLAEYFQMTSRGHSQNQNSALKTILCAVFSELEEGDVETAIGTAFTQN